MTEPQYPPPQSVAQLMKKEQLQRQFAILGDILNAGTLLVDLRRNDFQGGTIRGSINIPAEGFPLNLSTLYRLCVAGDGLAIISRIVFYCGSSTGRGPRCAGWFQDYSTERAVREGHPGAGPQVFTLEGGIKDWVKGGSVFTDHMDGYIPEYWAPILEPKTGAKRGIDDEREVRSETRDSSPSKRSRSQARMDDIVMQ